MTASRSLRDIRRASFFAIGISGPMSDSTSAAMSVGNVSPGKRDSLPMPARDSRIDRHTSSLLRPIEQMIPAPVTAMRTFGSGMRMCEIKLASDHFYSIHGAPRAETKRAAERRVERDHEANHVARQNGAIDLARVDAGEESLFV